MSKSSPNPDEALEAISTITSPEAEKYLGEVGRAYPARTAQSDAWYQGELKSAKPALTVANKNTEPFHASANLSQVQQLFQQYGIPALNGQQSAAECSSNCIGCSSSCRRSLPSSPTPWCGG